MKAKDAAKLTIGDRVEWTEDDAPVYGEVTETGYNAIKVMWDDGQAGIYPFTGKSVPHIERIGGRA